MAEISYHSLVWLNYRLGATFAFGLPLVLWLWSFWKKESSITRLLSIYWKIASLMIISMLLLTGNRPIGYLTSFISPWLIIFSIWFWIDLNEEINELPTKKALPFLLKAWRWSISFFSCFFIALSFRSLSCMNEVSGNNCTYWREAPSGLNLLIKSIFNFLFGASWTEALSAFIGYLALIIYLVGIIQWAIIRLPKQGRIAGGF
ncbi:MULTISPECIES: DUF3177 family protein [unclassified Prochlorococcus]|uniref:DUF3177 family protein n=1 Tax=unclassified Prochlorococcus TaxID=2627481 RepID=UPI0005337FD7|nr:MULTISPECIES: DUF3177 family protein [unclassified Prochlorococcus]KGG16692.1 L-lactate permease [Prochlorococcus sp. MIT 0602]KGG18336.1 L-lactate permease [Prochlorococcus sp. MIT 0603]